MGERRLRSSVYAQGAGEPLLTAALKARAGASQNQL
jgi:hypothetical protein